MMPMETLVRTCWRWLRSCNGFSLCCVLGLLPHFFYQNNDERLSELVAVGAEVQDCFEDESRRAILHDLQAQLSVRSFGGKPSFGAITSGVARAVGRMNPQVRDGDTVVPSG